MHWEVLLTGDDACLGLLHDSMREGATILFKGRDGYMLRSTELNDLKEASEVRRAAQTMVTALSGALRTIIEFSEGIKVAGVDLVQDDGKRAVFMHVEPVALTLRVLPPAIVLRKKDGTVEESHPADRIVAWPTVAASNPEVAKALRLRNERDLGWVELYRLFEVIEADVGKIDRMQPAPVSDSEIRRFKHTANSVAAAGDKARHGKESTQPPKNPMLLDEARSLIDRLLTIWIGEKARAALRKVQGSP